MFLGYFEHEDIDLIFKAFGCHFLSESTQLDYFLYGLDLGATLGGLFKMELFLQKY